MDRLMASATPAWRWPLTGAYPPVNLTRADGSIVLEALCPGADRASFEITVGTDTLTIGGERKAEPGVPEERYHRRERPLGTFSRTIKLTERMDPERATAEYTNGILRLSLALTPETAPRKITIQS